MPENLIQMIRKFASELDSWLQAALEDLPENLRAVKIDCNYHLLTIVNNNNGDLNFDIFWGVQWRGIFVTCYGDKVP